MRLLLCLLLGAPILTAASSASAADEKETCLDAHVDAQASMKRGHVGESRIKLAVCSRKTCPKPITDDCVRWLDEAERAQPSVVVAVRDASGIDVPGARLWVDEVLVADRLDGRPIEVDPGEHVLRASSSARGETSNELRVIVRAGEKARPLAITLEAPSPPTRPATQRPPSATPTAPPLRALECRSRASSSAASASLASAPLPFSARRATATRPTTSARAPPIAPLATSRAFDATTSSRTLPWASRLSRSELPPCSPSHRRAELPPSAPRAP